MENKELDFSEQSENNTQKTKKKNIKNFLWPILFIVIAALTFWAVTAQSKDFSFSQFMSFLGELDIKFVILAILATLGFVVFEGVAIKTIASSFGFKRSFIKSYSYSAADIYFSSITPSATGGQPASALLMIRDAIPGSVVTVVLLVNLVMYTFAILVIGVIAFLLNPSMFLNFSPLSKTLIIIGCICQIAIATLFITLLVKSEILYSLGNFLLKLLAKLRIVKKLDMRRERLRKSIDTYAGYVSQIKDKKWMLCKAFLFNFLQRSSLVAVTVFVFLAYCGDASAIIDIGVAQSMVILGSNTVPIPGAMGVADYLMLDVFGELMASDIAVNIELLSRTLSFYFCVIICGITFLVRCILFQFKKRKAVK